MKNYKQSKWRFLYLSFFACLIFFVLRVDKSRAGSNPFIQTVLVLYKQAILSSDIAKMAKYDVLDVNRFNYADVNGATWSAIKAVNPAIQIYVYQLGAETDSRQDTVSQLYLNTISRYNVYRGHSMGALNTNHPSLFLLDSSNNRITDWTYNDNLMDFGSSAYQSYWIEATKTDIYNQAWRADGVFVDICSTDSGSSSYSPAGSVYPVKYSNATTWNVAMNNFVNAITAGMHINNQKIFANMGNSITQTGRNAWLALDGMATPPDIIMEEAFAAIEYGPGDVQFWPEALWKSQIDAIKSLQHSKVAVISHTNLTTSNLNGTDMSGTEAVNYWQILWYSMCSYHLARRDAPNNAYFQFGGDYVSTSWFDEYDRINLGVAVGDYSNPQTGIYRREFANGWVYVNSTVNSVSSVTLPASGRQLTHANINSDPTMLPIITTVSVPAHNGVIVLKSAPDAPPSAPTGLSVK